MSAYVILTRFRSRDPSEFEVYASKRAAFFSGHAVTWRAYFSGRFEAVEGPAVEGVSILEFPTFAEAQAWYTSPVYQEATRHRLLSGDYSVVIVEGGAPPAPK